MVENKTLPSSLIIPRNNTALFFELISTLALVIAAASYIVLYYRADMFGSALCAILLYSIIIFMKDYRPIKKLILGNDLQIEKYGGSRRIKISDLSSIRHQTVSKFAITFSENGKPITLYLDGMGASGIGLLKAKLQERGWRDWRENGGDDIQ